MLCEKCHENEASFIVSISSGSLVKELRICEECASYDDMAPEISGVGNKATSRECPNCHSRYLQSSLLGCPKCYDEFHDELKPVINLIHGSTIHLGEENTSKPEQRFDTKEKIHKLRTVYYAPSSDAGWMQQTGPDSDVIISTRIRLARNISGYRFCSLLDDSELSEVAGIVQEAISEIIGNPELPLYNSYIIDLGRLDNIDRKLLIERYLVSKDLVEKANEMNLKTGGAVSRSRISPFKVVINENETVSIMVNEEDHVRLQVINPGLQLEESWETIKAIDYNLRNSIEYAFSDEWGYLTACPTNVGTGLRASVMFHIPALATTKKGHEILSSIANMGYAVRGTYGEGTEAIGGFYQISNEFTLGQSGDEIVNRIQSVAQQIMNIEREERKNLIEREGVKTEDKIFRSYGILMNARLISSREALELLSWVSLGFNLGVLQNSKDKETSKTKIARLLVLIRPAHLQKYAGRQLNALARDLNRAIVIRAILNG